jgi:hypothetical protein
MQNWAQELTGRTGILIFVVILALVASWLAGYHEGEENGAFNLLRQTNDASDRTAEIMEQAEADRVREQVCNEIRRYKFSLAKDLDENTQICGWPDMDNRRDPN